MTTVYIGFRLEPEIVARLDALLPALSAPWHRAKRSEVIRAVIFEGLPILERRVKPSKKGGRS